jgi:predicted dehydrogenase
MEHEKIRVGIVGAGNISDQYLSNLTTFPDFDVIFVADLDRERAAAQAIKWGVPASGSLDELLANDQIQLVINLTIPAAHVPVSLAALNAGKHVWSEKPMALDRSGATQLLEAAKKNGVRLGIAPDTFLGAGVQTGLNAIRGGSIGKPLTALTIFQTAGPDSWHPDPAFLFAKGAGPLFDMGPYYVTTLVQIFGKATRVTATSSKSQENRTVGSGPKKGTSFPVEEPTQITALIEFASGASAVSIFSFEAAHEVTGFVEITGSEGAIKLPDPNNFDGESILYQTGQEPKNLTAVGNKHGRGLGALNMMQSFLVGNNHIASANLGNHVLDILISISESAARKESISVISNIDKNEALDPNWDPLRHFFAHK